MYSRAARIALIAVVLVTGLFVYQARNLRFNYVFENFFPTGDTDLEYYDRFREWFENDNDYLLIALTNEEGVFEQDFLTKVSRLGQELDSLPHLIRVIDPLRMERALKTPGGLMRVPILHIDAPDRYEGDSLRVYQDERLAGTWFSEDGRSVLIMLRHEPQLSKEESDILLASLEAVTDRYTFDNLRVSGKIKAQKIYISKMINELLIFLSASIVLVVVFLAVAYRQLWGVIVPLIVVMLSTLWILGLMGWIGKSLDILMILLPTIMFVVGMSDVVHVLTKYLEELRNGLTKVEALWLTFKEVGLATFLTSLTTAIGFFTLLTASILPVREFGVYTGIGVFMAFILAFTLLPAILFFMKTPKTVTDEKNRTWWRNTLGSIFIYIMEKKTGIIVLSGVLIVLSLVGISRIEINSYLIEDLPQDDPLKADFTFFDEQFAGGRPFEMTMTVTDSSRSVYDLEVLQAMDEVHAYLKDNYGAGAVVSPLTIVKSLHQSLNGGVRAAYRLPANEKEMKEVNRYLSRYLNRADMPQMTANDQHIARITGRLPDIGSAIGLKRAEELRAFLDERNYQGIEFRLTGTSLLIDKNNYYLASNILQGLGIAFGVIALIVGLLFKSLRMIIITLVPNIIPLLLVAGIMGYAGIDLKLSTSIVFSIAFGIAVDDTIHFISKFRIELKKGRSNLYALKRTFFSTGKAIIVTSVILAGGFMTLVLSEFGGTFYTGLLVGLTLIFAVLIDLTLLPVLLLLFFKRRI